MDTAERRKTGMMARDRNDQSQALHDKGLLVPSVALSGMQTGDHSELERRRKSDPTLAGHRCRCRYRRRVYRKIGGVFSATLRCSNYQCQQGVAVVGDYSTSLTGVGMWETERSYEILDIHPAILLIDIPEATPKPIKTSLGSSFPLYWRDPQACAGRQRTAVEDVLEHLGQPRKVRGKFVSLAVRLKNLKTLHPELAESADILRNLGNAGAHGGQVDRDQLLDSYELFEIELRKLFTDDATRRRALITKLRPPTPAAPPKP
jgi:hypothetical protein